MSANENNPVVTAAGCGAFDAETAAAYVEGLLAEPDRELYQSHLHGCGACRAYVDELRYAIVADAPSASPYAMPAGGEVEDEAARDAKSRVASALGVWRKLRVRTVVARTLLTIFAIGVIAASAVFLFLALRGQTRIQPPPSDLKYAPARPAPPVKARRDDASGGVDLDDLDDEDDDFDMPSPGYRPGVAPSYPIAPLEVTPQPNPAFQPPAARPESQQKSEPGPKSGGNASGAAAPPPPAPLRRGASVTTPRAKGPTYRRVGAKTFKQEPDGALVDTEFNPEAKLKVVELVAGSDEYNAVLTQIAALGQYFRLSDHLVVVFDDVVYRVSPRT